MATQKAYHKGTDVEVLLGGIIKDFRGNECVFEGVVRDAGPGYSAKVLTKGSWAKYAEAFPGIEVR